MLLLLQQSRRLVFVQFLPSDAKQDRDLRVAGDQHAEVKQLFFAKKRQGRRVRRWRNRFAPAALRA